MKYAHLDRIVNDDEDELGAIDAPVFLHRKGSSVTVSGYFGTFLITGKDVKPVQRALQRHVDNLTNSAAAHFLETNHRKSEGYAVKVIVRVPKIILTEVQREAEQAGSPPAT